MKLTRIFIFCLLSFTFFQCNTTKHTKTTVLHNPQDYVTANFVQLNDVYEIGALEDGKRGGLARVATVVNEMRAKNPNTYLIIAGDFLNPSFLGTLQYEGKAIKGRQMVDVLNTMKLDIAILGNHEFDLDYPDLQMRFDESKFKWLATDVYDATHGVPWKFHKNVDGKEEYFDPFMKIDVPNGEEDPLRIGLFSATIPLVKKDYILYKDFYLEANKAANEVLNKFTDVQIGITHLEIMQDTTLARSIQGVPLLMGGHDHENMKVQIGKTIITKADANAKSIYLHKVMMHKKTREVKIESTLKIIDDKIKEDSTVTFCVNKWKKIGEESMRKLGFDPYASCGEIKGKLNGRESSIRNEQNNLGEMVTKSMLFASPVSQGAVINSGSIRIDDFVTGRITEMDILRIMPYGGPLVEVELKGRLLRQIIEAGVKNKGKGGYLQRSKNFEYYENTWYLNKKKIEDDANYKIITGKFLFEGKEKNLEFFTKDNKDVVNFTLPDSNDKENTKNDVRKVFIEYLRSLN